LIVFLNINVYVIVKIRQGVDDSSPDSNTSFQVFDRSGVSEKFKPAWRYAGDSRVFLPRVSGRGRRLGLAGARRRRDAGGLEQTSGGGRSVGASFFTGPNGWSGAPEPAGPVCAHLGFPSRVGRS
jgi:hypothetical protein